MSRFHPLTVASVVRETRDAVVITLAVPGALRDAFRSERGQHLTVKAESQTEQLRRLLYKAARNDSGRIEIEITPHGVTICDHSEYRFEWNEQPDISGTTRVAPASSPD